LSRAIARIERDNKGVPILLKQYLKLAAPLDSTPTSSSATPWTGLIMVICAPPTRVLARYMGEDGATAVSRPPRCRTRVPAPVRDPVPNKAPTGLISGTL